MPNDARQQAATRPRSTQLDYTREFATSEEALLYYKEEYKRLKAIIALQKQKIKRLVATTKA